MTKIRIKLAVLGQLPVNFDRSILLQWKSDVFEVSHDIETFQLDEDAQGDDWEYTDNQLGKYLDNPITEDFIIILVTVKLEDNWYVRRLNDNKIVFSFYELREILQYQNIPVVNIILRLLYGASLVYRRYGDRIPPADEPTNYAHDELRGCLFDMNPNKWDVVESCHRPILCEPCVAQLKSAQVSNELIKTIQEEIRRIKKPLFSRLVDFVKSHPIWALVLSILTGLFVGVVSSVLGAHIFSWLTLE